MTDTNTLRDALLPCPFCGGRASALIEHDADWPDKCFMSYKCLGCGAQSGNVFGTRDPSEWAEARENWNARAALAAKPAESEAPRIEILAAALKLVDARLRGGSKPRVRPLAAYEAYDDVHRNIVADALAQAVAPPQPQPAAEPLADDGDALTAAYMLGRYDKRDAEMAAKPAEAGALDELEAASAAVIDAATRMNNAVRAL